MFAFQDMEKTEKKSKRMQELETVNNNIKLLNEMLQHYTQNSSQSDKEILKVGWTSLNIVIYWYGDEPFVLVCIIQLLHILRIIDMTFW